MNNADNSRSSDDHVVLGKLTSPYGVKGWLKVYSYTSPMERILDYPEWWLRQGERLTRYTIAEGRRQGKGMVVSFEEVSDRSAAEAIAGAEILMSKSHLPKLGDDEYYWHELEGLSVFTQAGERLGRIQYLFETGANDVMVVRGDAEAIDKRERLIPFLPDEVILEVALENDRMVVDWDPDF
ncbi:ribosome maturation factor RimM [Halomonas sp. Bachu 37]|uniref:ribosome maturation factor RimM n=1 Tax=Halomonas kashgarensis TaxID=3084920 RepID=UPI003216DB11